MTPDFKIVHNKTVYGLLVLAILASFTWLYRYVVIIGNHQTYKFMPLFLGMFGLIAWQLILAWMEKPYTVTKHQNQQLDKLKVTVNVPVYNEEPKIVLNTIRALFKQSRLPNRIQVVDDGSKLDYDKLRLLSIKYCPAGVDFSWVKQQNGGKRTAQMHTFVGDDCDIFVTIDSDTALHKHAIREGLKPFVDQDVMSVAGLEIGINKRDNLLSLTLDMVVNVWQFTARSALSRVGNVLTNSGPLALYRREVIQDNVVGYLNETIAGHKVMYSDDSLLTLYALTMGKTVQQITSVGYVMRPTNFSHIVRQQLRWCRGMFIRSLWRYKYLPLNSWGFWYELVVNWLQFISTIIVFIYLFVYTPIIDHRLVWLALIIPLIVTYTMTIRTLIIKRSDETTWQWFSTWLISPLIILWGWLLFRPIRIWGALTFTNMSWGTRQKVETKI